MLDSLANCGDVLPADYCDQLDIPKGSLYADAVADVHQQTKNTTKRTAEEVYWSYVAMAGEDACAYAVLNYLDGSIVVEILLKHIDAEDLDDFLHDNVI